MEVVLIGDVDVAVPVTTPPTCPSIHGSLVGDGGEGVEGGDRGYESGSVDAYTNTSPLGSPRPQCCEGGNPAEVLGDVTAEDEPYLAEGTFLDSRYRILKILGHGNFSTTYLAEETPTEPEPPDMPPSVVAIKRLKKPYTLIGENEFLLLGFLHEGEEKPRHIISPIASFFSETEHFHLVLEPLDSARPVSLTRCCCISRTVHSNLACPLRHLSLAKILVQLLSGLLSLHSHRLIHADLTPANVLFLPSSNRIKLIDLGNAIQPDDREAYLDDFGVQSACYRAPEILLGSGPLSRVMDVWSAGVIAVELLFDGEVVGEGREGAELMRNEVDGREALVLRTVELVGSVREYAGGMYYMDMYDEVSLEPAVFTPEGGNQGGPLAEKKGILRKLLEDATENMGLVDFLMNMMEVGVGRRKTVDGMLKHPWLIRQLLDNWGDVLTGWMEDDYGRGGATGDIQDQLELVPEEGSGFDGVQRSELVEDIPKYGGFLFSDGQRSEEDQGQSLEVGRYEDIRSQSTDELELDLQSSHASLSEDISTSTSFEGELQFDVLKREQSADILEPALLPPLAGRSPYHSPWKGVSGSPHLERQLQFDEVKRELSSSLACFQFGEEDEVNYLDNRVREHTDSSVPETPLITENGTTSITPGGNVLSSLPSSPPPTTPPLLEDITVSPETRELYSTSPVALAKGVEQVEQVEQMESALLSAVEGEVIEDSGVWHRDLAADMVCVCIFFRLMSKLG